MSQSTDRIAATFERLAEENRAAFVAYVAAGDPSFDVSLEILHSLERAGVDIIEIGVPFSDPLADGIVNQLAAERALRSGMNTTRVLDLIKAFRQNSELPVVLFTYLNPIYNYGFEKFHQDASAAGADGILLLDLPPDEAALNAELAGQHQLHSIRLIAPTTPDERVASISKTASGFIYALSRKGVTGTETAPQADVSNISSRIKAHTKVPVCVGFGISSPEQVKSVANHADGVVVGSAIVDAIAKNQHADNLDELIYQKVHPMVEATRRNP